jgi:hypothetical protein
MVTGFAGRPSVSTNNYIHDAADTANNVYHHDGIGPQSEGNGGPMVIYHNTLASLGNTNALALQGHGTYDHIAFTNNYVSGYGYAVSIGVTNNATNITFTGNVFSASFLSSTDHSTETFGVVPLAVPPGTTTSTKCAPETTTSPTRPPTTENTGGPPTTALTLSTTVTETAR